MLIWTKHWKAIGPPQRAITYIFVPGINNWFWRRLIYIIYLINIIISYSFKFGCDALHDFEATVSAPWSWQVHVCSCQAGLSSFRETKTRVPSKKMKNDRFLSCWLSFPLSQLTDKGMAEYLSLSKKKSEKDLCHQLVEVGPVGTNTWECLTQVRWGCLQLPTCK